jgi:thiol-disulfide isomerase/thioredoxin
VKRLIPAALAVLLLAGCAADPLATQYQNGTNQNYISGDGSLSVIAEADRGPSVEFEGETDAGASVSSADYAGEVLVVNFWYAACPPCRLEAPDLEALAEQFAGEGASFLGVNVRDQAENARNFAEKWGISYPSVIDANDGNMLYAFAGTVAPNAVPTTLVIDKQGRVAARILGLVSEPSTLEAIINDVIAEAD